MSPEKFPNQANSQLPIFLTVMDAINAAGGLAEMLTGEMLC
jgi:protein involved in polysaccharide export with SLBB domain